MSQILDIETLHLCQSDNVAIFSHSRRKYLPCTHWNTKKVSHRMAPLPSKWSGQLDLWIWHLVFEFSLQNFYGPWCTLSVNGSFDWDPLEYTFKCKFRMFVLAIHSEKWKFYNPILQNSLLKDPTHENYFSKIAFSSPNDPKNTFWKKFSHRKSGKND